MILEERVQSLIELGKRISPPDDALNEIIEQAFHANRWFTPENIHLALLNIKEKFLYKETLEKWLSTYSFPENKMAKSVGIVMAGNLALVGFHDLLCVLISGNKALIKLSSKDNVLLPFLLKSLFEINPEWKNFVQTSDLLKGMDAVIATGSNNTSRYFEYYFGRYPHIFRRHRNAVAVLDGTESHDELEKLGFDIFSYFGLGCRNVSKLLVPDEYVFDMLLESLSHFKKISDHNKYMNNYDYNRTLLLLNNTPHLANDFLMLKQDTQVASPVSVLHYEYYSGESELLQKLNRDEATIQLIAGKKFNAFGNSQSPELWDYADGADTIKFLEDL